MAMTAQELEALKDRCLYAATHGFKIARAEEYAKALLEAGASKAVPEGAEELSAAHLLAMAQSALSGEKPKAKKSAPKEKPAEPKTEAKAEKAPEPKAEEKPAEPAAEPAKAAEPEVVADPFKDR